MIIQGKHDDLDITDDILSGLKASYPQLDIENELAKMHWWLVKNPSRIPVRPEFRSAWLNRGRHELHQSRAPRDGCEDKINEDIP